MLKYSKYLLSSVARKKAPYLIILGFFFIFDSTTFLQIKEMNKNFLPMLNTMSTFDKFFPFLFATLFTAMIVIYTFKQGESDGSELMVVAKPISRTQIIFGKFLVVFIYMFAYTVLAFLNYYGLSFLDSYINNGERIKYAGSLALGGFVVLIIVASTLIIFASFLNKTGLLAIGVVASSIIPIISFILSPVGKGQAFGYQFLNERRQKVNIEELNKALDNQTQAKAGELTGREIQTIVDSEKIYVNDNTKQDNEFAKYKDEIWYDKASPIDLWYQWGRFYSIFQERNTGRSALSNWKRKAITVSAKDANTIEIGGEKYVFFVNLQNLVQIPKIIPLIPEIYKLILKSNTTSYTIKWNDLSLYDRLYNLNETLAILDKKGYEIANIPSVPNFTESKASDFESRSNISSLTVLTLLYLEKVNNDSNSSTSPNYQQAQSAYPSFVTTDYTSQNGIGLYSTSQNPSVDMLLPVSSFAKEGSKIYSFVSDEFIQTNYILISWGLLAVAFLSTALILFLRRDFR